MDLCHTFNTKIGQQDFFLIRKVGSVFNVCRYLFAACAAESVVYRYW